MSLEESSTTLRTVAIAVGAAAIGALVGGVAVAHVVKAKLGRSETPRSVTAVCTKKASPAQGAYNQAVCQGGRWCVRHLLELKMSVTPTDQLLRTIAKLRVGALAHPPRWNQNR